MTEATEVKISEKLQNILNPEQSQNLKLIEQIKKYSVDSLNYKPTRNFTTITCLFRHR